MPCNPWAAEQEEVLPKSSLKVDMRRRRHICPAGKTHPFTLGTIVEFDAHQGQKCPLREQCTTAEPGRGKSIRIAEDELLQHRLRKLARNSTGRERLRKRVSMEHRLAHLSRRQGP